MRHMFKAALLAAVSFVVAPAAAQEAEDDLIITATRQPSEAARLPADVDVIDIEDARRRGVASLADALAEAPGLNVVQSGGFGQQTSLFSAGANSNHTLVLFDGLRLNDPSTPGSSFDAGQDMLGGLARIEVVQGPMSAVFGSDAIGGIVNILPRHGREGVLNAQLDVSAGSFSTLSAMAGIDGTLGRFRYALTAEGYASGGYDLVPERMATHTGDEDGAEAGEFTGVFDLEVTDVLAIDVLVRRRQARADFDPFIFPPPSFNEQRVDDPDLEIADNDLSIGRIGATWRVHDAVSLRASGGAMEQDRKEQDAAVVTSTFQGNRRFADISADWRFADTGVLSNAGIVAGIETETEEVDINQGFATVVAEQDHRGGFLTAQGDIGLWTLTGALRLDNFDGFGTQTTWRGGISYNVTAFRLYAAYGTSFRAPTLYERFIFFGNPDLDPERGRAWEIGAHVRLAAFGHAEGVEVGLLYRSADIEDLIDFNSSFTYANIDEAQIDSAEAQVALRPTSWLTARVAYAFTDAQDAAANTPLLRRPEDAWRVSLDFERGPFSAQLAWRYVSERADQIYGDDGFWAGVGVTPDYDVLRASAAWQVTPNAEVYVAADNLTDQAYEPTNAFAGALLNVMVGLRLRPQN